MLHVNLCVASPFTRGSIVARRTLHYHQHTRACGDNRTFAIINYAQPHTASQRNASHRIVLGSTRPACQRKPHSPGVSIRVGLVLAKNVPCTVAQCSCTNRANANDFTKTCAKLCSARIFGRAECHPATEPSPRTRNISKHTCTRARTQF